MNTTQINEDPEVKAAMRAYGQKMATLTDKIKADRIAGEEALRRLLPIAQRDSGQSQRVARILLGLYNGHRFPLDLTNLRGLDYEILHDCLTVLRMDANAYMEVHLYFPNGGAIFEKLASDWRLNKKAKAAQ